MTEETVERERAETLPRSSLGRKLRPFDHPLSSVRTGGTIPKLGRSCKRGYTIA